MSAAIERVRSLRLTLAATAGWRGAMRALEVMARSRTRPPPGGHPPIEVPMGALGGEPFAVRPGTSDLANAAAYYALGLYRPPPQVGSGDLRRICELGSNTGAALAALAHSNPCAELLGIEPDPGNIEIARLNTARYGDRCRLVRSAIWEESVELVVDATAGRGEHGLTVRPRRPGDPEGLAGFEALTIDELLDGHFPGAAIDFMQVNIEGTEPRAFAAAGAWPERVRALRVELHPYYDYGAEACIAQLRGLGYVAWPDPALPEKWVLALRR